MRAEIPSRTRRCPRLSLAKGMFAAWMAIVSTWRVSFSSERTCRPEGHHALNRYLKLSGCSIRSANGWPQNTLSVLVIPDTGTRGAKLHDRVSRAARGFRFSWAVIELWWLHRIVRKEYLRVALSHDLKAANEQCVPRCARAMIHTPPFDSHLYLRTGCGFLHGWSTSVPPSRSCFC